MKSILKVLLLSCVTSLAHAAGGGDVHLDHVDVDIRDKPSLQRGAAMFTNYCMGCHSLKYSRYERVADDIGIPHNLYEENLIFGDAKIGQLMDIAMAPSMAQSWFGAAPPDLTLVSRLRGPDWLYSYLRGFYKDESRPWGVNNVVFKDVGMPHVLVDLQGLCAEKPELGSKAGIDPLSGVEVGAPGCKSFATTGSMEPQEYDAAIRDMVNFLAYVGEPSRLESEEIAPFVLLFLVVLFVPAYLLNREYWKDVH
ncbi:cytochrome c1 [Hahella aquimaris]|uniref:cytochrome c1 n=1 Tax=Hahella sp. HNIBRBA332 TaxID=3015983 RepID=UPI00273B3866|nr:cytochrome c1 [Hahella sp. HNIBRBA332]WLQ14087.1 cytochrome c1 [Hahella sp. HNIBRBA332]